MPMEPERDDVRCPTCGIGVVADIAYDAGTAREEMPPHDPSARQLTTYSCGHQVLGPRLETADPERLDVERRATEETVDPLPGSGDVT
jgi:hypothetical protein